MATIKSHTTIEQSRKLAEILPLESADMCWCLAVKGEPEVVLNKGYNKFGDFEIPCWSLAALLEIIPYGQVNKDAVDSNKWETSSWNETDFDPILSIGGFDNPVDACYEMILKLKELNLL